MNKTLNVKEAQSYAEYMTGKKSPIKNVNLKKSIKSMKVQPHVSSNDGKLFNISFKSNELSFKILELTSSEILRLLTNIKDQTDLLKKSYKRG